jgi:hypothetical protein
MRTTLTIDADVAARLERLRRDGRPFKQLVNDALRAGLDAFEREGRPEPRRRYTTPMALGRPLVDNVDDVWGVLDAVDGPGL